MFIFAYFIFDVLYETEKSARTSSASLRRHEHYMAFHADEPLLPLHGYLPPYPSLPSPRGGILNALLCSISASCFYVCSSFIARAARFSARNRVSLYAY